MPTLARLYSRLEATPVALLCALCIAVAITVRLAIMQIVPVPIESDALSYMLMAEDFASARAMQDEFGQHLFFSAGYPIFLGIFFKIFGGSLVFVQTINLLLAALSLVLVMRIVLLVGGGRVAALLAGIGYSIWIPAAYGTAFVLKENLSTPLLLLVLVCVIQLAQGEKPRLHAFLGGLSYGFGLLAGASSMLVGILFPVAFLIHWKRSNFAETAQIAALAAAALIVTLGPWLAYGHAQTGAIMLNSNSGFNLYLGNNPAADGHFVNIADTPMGANWHDYRAQADEVQMSRDLQSKAVEWIHENPVQAATLAGKKLLLFWMPNIPDAAEIANGNAHVVARWLDVAQFVALIALGLIAAIALRRAYPKTRWIIAAIGLFWILHSAAYIIVRYREPIMPLLIVLAALLVAHWCRPRPEAGYA